MQNLELRKRNEEFIREMKEYDPTFFDELKKGQAPEFFVLSCSDSRVSPSVVTQMPLGHMFVHRNIANQISIEDESFSASLSYALRHLNVKVIVIKGHTDCGGVKAAWSGNNEEELRGWIGKVRKSLPDHNLLKDVSMDELTRENVLSQVKHLQQHPIYKKYGQGVQMIGCLFHVESGELERVYPL
ncbi:carbonic anhydrase [Halalkalibacter krulwichiae]|uniref:carbonic anhydrase n=1 Tax=Halalkalibacter krulwichiae TaxID=199441 RepID=A0A1X9MB66_9BACI|nr:carbonic anhydrase [Halalkalibacter krulwichiae]ARK30667.1 Carbonic anhydrase 2 [Halalkalibacter krulwichiae]